MPTYTYTYTHVYKERPPQTEEDRRPRSAHEYGDCQLLYLGSEARTAGETMWGLLDEFGEGYPGPVRLEDVQGLIDDYFASNPDGVITIGYYTPRARKRRGLPRSPRRMLSLRLGTTRHYFPTLNYWADQEVTVRADRITIRCRCRGANRPNTPHLTTLWSRPA